MNESKHCFECEHCEYSGGDPGYSEMTPGYPMTLRCSKKKWDAFDGGYGIQYLLVTLRMANDCKYYKKVRDLNEPRKSTGNS